MGRPSQVGRTNGGEATGPVLGCIMAGGGWWRTPGIGMSPAVADRRAAGGPANQGRLRDDRACTARGVPRGDLDVRLDRGAQLSAHRYARAIHQKPVKLHSAACGGAKPRPI